MARNKGYDMLSVMAMLQFGANLVEIVTHPNEFAAYVANVNRVMWECRKCHYQHSPFRTDVCGW